MDVPTFIKQVYSENISKFTSENYVRNLKEILAQKPYLTNVNWKNDLFVLNTNRKSADFGNYPVLHKTNGIIMRVPENYMDLPSVVLYSFNVIQDYNENMEKKFNEKWEDYVVEPITDGAIIRVWKDDQWNVSTIKCIDARDANWSNNKSFYDLFEEACKEMNFDYGKLNEDYCYTFVLKHPANHMILQYDRPRIVHLCTTNRNDNFNYVDHDVGLLMVPRLKFNSFEEFWKDLNREQKVLDDTTLLGYIVTEKDTNNKYKFESPIYKRVRELKGNVPNIRYRIINVIRDNNVDEFLSYFPQYKDDVQFVNKRIDGLIGDLYNTYKLNSVVPLGNNELKTHCNYEIRWIAKEEGYVNYQRVKEYVYSLSAVRIGILTGIPYYLHQKFHRGRRLRQPRFQFVPRTNQVLAT